MTAQPDTAAPAIEVAQLRHQLAELARLWNARLDAVGSAGEPPRRHAVRVGARLAAALDRAAETARPGP